MYKAEKKPVDVYKNHIKNNMPFNKVKRGALKIELLRCLF